MKTAEFNNNYKTNLITLGSLLGVTLLSGVVLTSSITSADNDSVVDDVSISVPTSCTMSSSGTSSHTAEINNGQYNSAVGETTINAFCNDNAGFAIYAIGFTGNTLGSNVLANESLPSSNIATGTATSGQTSNWAMKLSTITSPAPTYPIIISGSESDTQKETGDSDYSSFQQVPDDYTKVAYRTAGTDTGADAEGSTVKTTYQVYISPNQPAGTYNGKVKYVMVHPSTADTPTIPPTFTWQASSATKPADSEITVTFQDFDSATCEIGTNGQIGWLKDSRDNQVYKIAKLADGKCWMVENLNLAGGSALSAENTDVTSAYISNYTSSTTESENGRLIKSGDTLVLPTSSTSGFINNYYSYIYNSNNKENCGASGQNTPCYSYYSWDAATLGSGRSISADNTDAGQSICPKNWKLPTAYTTSATNWQNTSDFYVLAHQYGLDSTTSTSESDNGFYTLAGPGTVPSFLLSGYYNSNTFYGGGETGFYWSSTSASSTYSGHLNFGTSDVNSASYYIRRLGLSVRCVLH